MARDFDTDQFANAWNALERSDRLRLRRLVRMGRPVDDDATLAGLAPAYARWQMGRTWMRLFWLWFVPGLVIALGIATQIHPVVVGVTLALGGQAVWTHFNLRKTARRLA